MARQLARGLFRLWLVASIVWVCAVGAVTWSTLPKVLPPFDQLPDQSKLVTDPNLLAQLNDPKLQAPKPPFDPSKPYDVVVTAAERNALLFRAGQIAFIPPVLLLVVGAALGWAVKGFRG